jgi:hypothetical protein
MPVENWLKYRGSLKRLIGGRMKKQRNLNSLQTRSRRLWAMKALGTYRNEEIAALRRSTAVTAPSALATTGIVETIRADDMLAHVTGVTQ